MATSPYFKNNGPRREHPLEASILQEFINRYGIDVLYIPRKINAIDELMNEVTYSTFEVSYDIEVYLENYENPAPNNFLMERLGLGFSSHTIDLYVSVDHFKASVPNTNLTASDRPNEGDLIFIPHANLLLEIKKADNDSLIESGGNNTSYHMQCELFKYASEPMLDPVTIDSDQAVPDALLGADLVVDDEVEVTTNDDYGDNDLFDSDLILRCD